MRLQRADAAAIAAGIVVRFVFWLTTPVTGDACFHYSVAKYIAETQTIPAFEYVTGPNPFWWPPLFHITTAVVYGLIGALTLTPLIYGCLGLVGFHLFCRRFYPKVALEATVILSLLPFHVYYSSIGYFETLLFLLSVAAFHFYFQYLGDSRTKSLIYALIPSALAASTHYHGFIPMLAITGHLILRDKRRALVFFAAGLVLASPWYVRNYMVFGNPIWPKLLGGRYPDDRAVSKVPLTQVATRLTDPGRWTSTFLDFWVGAPNSGEDFTDKLDVGRHRYPLFDEAVILWFLSVFAASALTLWGLYRMGGEGNIRFAAIVLVVSLAPFILNNLSRMFVSFIPFAVIACAKGLQGIKIRGKHIILVFVLLILTGGSYGYSYAYRGIRDSYLPFFERMRDGIPDDARVVMPFNIQDCVYYTGRHCLRVGSTGGISTAPREYRPDNIDGILAEHDVSYVCCSSLNWDALSEGDRFLCSHFKNTPTIEYTDGGLWGRCWSTGET
jgi:hypothetical protein